MAFNINAQVVLSGPKNLGKIKQTIQKSLGGSIPVNITFDPKAATNLAAFNKQLSSATSGLQKITQATNAFGTALKTVNSNTASVVSGIQKINNAAAKTSSSLAQATSQMQLFGKDAALAVRRFSAFTIATGAIYGFVRSIQQATKEAIEFQREMNRLKIVSDGTDSQIKDFQNTVDQLSTSLGLSSNEIAKIGVTIAQSGRKMNEVKSIVAAIAKASLTPSFGDMEDTAEGVIAVLEQFQISANRTEAVLGSLNAVSKAFAVESSDLIATIRKTGGVFATASADLSKPEEALADLLGIFTSVRATTRESAETIATGLRTIFSRLQRRSTIEFLKQFQIDLVDTEGKFVGFFESFRRLSEGLGGIQKAGDVLTIAKIVEELGGIRQVGKLIPAIQQFTKAEQARKVALEGTGSMTRDVAAATETLSVKIQQLQQRFTKLIRDIADSSTFRDLSKFALDSANAFITMADSLRPLIPLLTSLAAIKLGGAAFDFGKGFLGGIKKKYDGGPIHRFARGGLVPGQGNQDSVNAMLTPGEYVIKKSSVEKLGTGYLNSINSGKRRYAAAGYVGQMSINEMKKYKDVQGLNWLTKKQKGVNGWQDSDRLNIRYKTTEIDPSAASKNDRVQYYHGIKNRGGKSQIIGGVNLTPNEIKGNAFESMSLQAASSMTKGKVRLTGKNDALDLSGAIRGESKSSKNFGLKQLTGVSLASLIAKTFNSIEPSSYTVNDKYRGKFTPNIDQAWASKRSIQLFVDKLRNFNYNQASDKTIRQKLGITPKDYTNWLATTGGASALSTNPTLLRYAGGGILPSVPNYGFAGFTPKGSDQPPKSITTYTFTLAEILGAKKLEEGKTRELQRYRKTFEEEGKMSAAMARSVFASTGENLGAYAKSDKLVSPSLGKTQSVKIYSRGLSAKAKSRGEFLVSGVKRLANHLGERLFKNFKVGDTFKPVDFVANQESVVGSILETALNTLAEEKEQLKILDYSGKVKNQRLFDFPGGLAAIGLGGMPVEVKKDITKKDAKSSLNKKIKADLARRIVSMEGRPLPGVGISKQEYEKSISEIISSRKSRASKGRSEGSGPVGNQYTQPFMSRSKTFYIDSEGWLVTENTAGDKVTFREGLTADVGKAARKSFVQLMEGIEFPKVTRGTPIEELNRQSDIIEPYFEDVLETEQTPSGMRASRSYVKHKLKKEKFEELKRLGKIKFFASGGGVGTDTVPALLTPGEFVINRESARAIGYSNLARMNKHGKAAGGAIQKFANGGIVQAFSDGGGIQPLPKTAGAKFSSIGRGVSQSMFLLPMLFSSLNSGVEGFGVALSTLIVLINEARAAYAANMLALAQQTAAIKKSNTEYKAAVAAGSTYRESRFNVFDRNDPYMKNRKDKFGNILSRTPFNMGGKFVSTFDVNQKARQDAFNAKKLQAEEFNKAQQARANRDYAAAATADAAAKQARDARLEAINRRRAARDRSQLTIGSRGGNEYLGYANRVFTYDQNARDPATGRFAPRWTESTVAGSQYRGLNPAPLTFGQRISRGYQNIMGPIQNPSQMLKSFQLSNFSLNPLLYSQLAGSMVAMGAQAAGQKEISGYSGFSGAGAGLKSAAFGGLSGTITGAGFGAMAGSFFGVPGQVAGGVIGGVVGGLVGLTNALKNQAMYSSLEKLQMAAKKAAESLQNINPRVGSTYGVAALNTQELSRSLTQAIDSAIVVQEPDLGVVRGYINQDNIRAAYEQIDQQTIQSAQETFSRIRDEILGLLPPEQLANFVGLENDLQGFYEALNALQVDPNFQASISTEQRNKLGQQIRALQESRNLVTLGNMENVFKKFGVLEQSQRDFFGDPTNRSIRTTVAAEDLLKNISTGMDIKKAAGEALKNIFSSQQINQLGAGIYDPQIVLQYADANENLNAQQRELIISLATFAQNSSGAGVALYAQNQLQEQQNRLLALSNARVNAFAAALNKLQTIFTRATNDLSVFGDNFDQNIARITQGTQGISMPKNVNVFSDLAGRSTSEIAKSLQDLNRGFLGGRLAIEGIPELLTVQEKLPQLFQQFINDVQIARGQGRGENLQGTTQLVNEFISSYGSQLGLSALPKEFQDLFERTLTNVLNAASRQDTDEKNIGIDALRQELITNFETNFENFGAQADKARAIFERLTESSNKLEENFLKLSSASLESSKGQKEAGLAIQERFARFAALNPNADERTLAFGNFNARLNTILNQGRIGGGNRMLSMDLVRERGLLIQERKQLESERQQMPNRIDSPEAERNRQALERNEDALRRVEEAINYATGETERLSSIQNKLASIEESRLDSRQKLSAFLNQLSGARNPMEAQRAIQEYFQPAIAAQQIQAFGGTSLPNLASLYQSLLEGPTGIAARYMGGAGGPLNAQSIDRYLAGTTQFLLPGLADIVGQSVGNLGFGQRAVGTAFGPGAYTAMGTPQQQQLVGQYGAILASQSKMLQDNANLNSQLLLDQQDVYRKSIETTNQIIASAIQQYQNLLNNPIPGARGLDQTISLLNDSINKLNESINRLNQINNPDLSPGARFEKLQPLVEKIIFGAVNGAFGQKGEYKAFGGVIGGPKGTDTVPAWLTPGEFVIQKSSAEKIGYSNLQRMNAGYYQEGGVVGDSVSMANKKSGFGFDIRRTGIQGENAMLNAMQNILPAFAGKAVAEADQMVNLDRDAMPAIKNFRNQLNKLVGNAYLDNLVDSAKVPRNNIDPKSIINNFIGDPSLLESFGYFENISSYFKDLYEKINPLAYTDVGIALREFSKYVFESNEHPGTERQFFTKRLGEKINDYYFRLERKLLDEAMAAEDIVAANPKPAAPPPTPAAPPPPKPAAPPPAPAAGVSKDKTETLAEKIAAGAATGAVIGPKGAKKLERDAKRKARFEKQRQRNREDQAVAAKEAVEDLFQSPQIADIYEKAGIKDELNTINSSMDFGDWTGAAETRLATALQSPSDQTFGPFNRVDYQKANYMIGRDKYIYAGKFLEIPPQPNETREQKQARIQANNKIQAEVSKRFKNRSTIRAKNKYVKDIVDLVTKNSDLQPDLAEMLGKPVNMATLATDLQSISNPEIVKTYQELVNLNVERRRPERIDDWIKSRGISDPVAAAKIKEQILKNQSLDTSWDDIAERVYFTPERVKKAEAQARAFKEKKKRELLGEDVVPNQDSNFYEGQMGIPSGVPRAGRDLIASAEEARKELNDITRWPPFFNKIGKRLQDLAAYSQTQDQMNAVLGQRNQYQETIADQNAISVGVRILNNPWMAASEFVVSDPALRNEFNALRNGDTPESAEFRRFLSRQYDLNRAAHGLDLTEEIFNKIQDERYGVNDPTSQGRRRDAFIRKATGGVVPSYLNNGGHPGGPMGTDTVPAWLTPGEFVVKKDSAQKIGYSNLHRMNRTGYLADGGIAGYDNSSLIDNLDVESDVKQKVKEVMKLSKEEQKLIYGIVYPDPFTGQIDKRKSSPFGRDSQTIQEYAFALQRSKEFERQRSNKQMAESYDPALTAAITEKRLELLGKPAAKKSFSFSDAAAGLYFGTNNASSDQFANYLVNPRNMARDVYNKTAIEQELIAKRKQNIGPRGITFTNKPEDLEGIKEIYNFDRNFKEVLEGELYAEAIGSALGLLFSKNIAGAAGGAQAGKEFFKKLFRQSRPKPPAIPPLPFADMQKIRPRSAWYGMTKEQLQRVNETIYPTSKELRAIIRNSYRRMYRKPDEINDIASLNRNILLEALENLKKQTTPPSIPKGTMYRYEYDAEDVGDQITTYFRNLHENTKETMFQMMRDNASDQTAKEILDSLKPKLFELGEFNISNTSLKNAYASFWKPLNRWELDVPKGGLINLPTQTTGDIIGDIASRPNFFKSHPYAGGKMTHPVLSHELGHNIQHSMDDLIEANTSYSGSLRNLPSFREQVNRLSQSKQGKNLFDSTSNNFRYRFLNTSSLSGDKNFKNLIDRYLTVAWKDITDQWNKFGREADLSSMKKNRIYTREDIMHGIRPRLGSSDEELLTSLFQLSHLPDFWKDDKTIAELVFGANRTTDKPHLEMFRQVMRAMGFKNGGQVPSYLEDGGHPGGPMGTDTVPAWLTPGEFVIKKDSAQKIGYSNLNRMNRTGYLAKGGIVDEKNPPRPGQIYIGPETNHGMGMWVDQDSDLGQRELARRRLDQRFAEQESPGFIANIDDLKLKRNLTKKDRERLAQYHEQNPNFAKEFLRKLGAVDLSEAKASTVNKTPIDLRDPNQKNNRSENPLGLGVPKANQAPPEQKPRQPQQPQDPPPCPSCPDIIDAQTKMTTVQKRALKNWCGRKDAYAGGEFNRFTVLDKISMRMRGYVPGYDPLTNTLMYPGIKGRNIHPRWNNGVNPFEAESQQRFLNQQLSSLDQQEQFLTAQLMQQMSPEQFQQVKFRFDAVKSMKEQLSEMLENVKNKNGCGDAAAAMAAAGNANQFFGKKGRGKRVRYNERPDVIQKRKERLEKEQKAGAELAMKELFTDQQILDIYKSVDLKGRDPSQLANEAIAKAKKETDPKMIFAGKFLELPIPANASKEEQSDIRKINGSIMAAVSRRRKELSDSKTQRKVEGDMMGMVGGPYLAPDLATAEREVGAYREQNVQVKSLERFNSYLDSFDIPQDETLRKQIKDAVDKGMDIDKAMDRFYFTPQRVDKYVAQARAFKAGKKAALLGENVGPAQDEEWNFYKGQMGVPSGVPQAAKPLIASKKAAREELDDVSRWPQIFKDALTSIRQIQQTRIDKAKQEQDTVSLAKYQQDKEFFEGRFKANAYNTIWDYINAGTPNPGSSESFPARKDLPDGMIPGLEKARQEIYKLKKEDSEEGKKLRQFLARQYDLNRAAKGLDLTEEDYSKIQNERYGVGDPTSQGTRRDTVRRRFATGGMVYGPSGTDQIPARLTSGEYVLNKGATYALGGKVLDYMNQTGKLPVYRATGGPMGNVPNGMSGGSGNFNFQIDFSQSIADFSKQINGVFTTAGDRFVNKINPLMASMQTLVQKLESLPAIQLQLDAKIGPVEVILNAGGLNSIITREVMIQVADQVHSKLKEYGLLRNASGGLPNQMK